MHLELGCGKGGFIAELAAAVPEINFLAMDMKSEVLALAKRKVEKSFAAAGRRQDNLLLFAWDIERLDAVFQPGEDVFERIYINFCNPWPKPRHHKHRLTHTRQLLLYRNYLPDGGQIRFKTDDDELFADSIGYFEEAGFRIDFLTRDLHASGFSENVETEHEQMFTEQGLTTKFLIAEKVGNLPHLAEKALRTT